MKCPKCWQENTTPVGSSHYVCNNPRCKQPNGERTQFRIQTDPKIHFPYNQIFVGRPLKDFYRIPYLEMKDVGVTSTTR